MEIRNTLDPALITQMLRTLLEVDGRRTFPPLLRKRVRDDGFRGFTTHCSGYQIRD